MSYLAPLQKLLQICFVDQIRVLCYSAWCPVSAGSSKLRLKCQMLLLKRCFSLIHSPQHNVHASHEPLPRWMCQNVCFSLLSVEQIAVVVCHSSECTPTTHWRSFHDIFASSVPNNTFLLILDLTVIWKPTENPFSFYFVMKTIRETWALQWPLTFIQCILEAQSLIIQHIQHKWRDEDRPCHHPPTQNIKCTSPAGERSCYHPSIFVGGPSPAQCRILHAWVLPHSGSMLFIDTLANIRPQSTTAGSRIWKYVFYVLRLIYWATGTKGQQVLGRFSSDVGTDFERGCKFNRKFFPNCYYKILLLTAKSGQKG